jgi:hypothetical protein
VEFREFVEIEEGSFVSLSNALERAGGYGSRQEGIQARKRPYTVSEQHFCKLGDDGRDTIPGPLQNFTVFMSLVILL